MINRKVKLAKLIRNCAFIFNNPCHQFFDFSQLFIDESFFNFTKIFQIKKYPFNISNGIIGLNI